MKALGLIFTLLLIVFSFFSFSWGQTLQAPQWQWAHGNQHPVSSGSKGYDVAWTSSGNLVYAGSLSGASTNFQLNGTPVSPDQGRLILLKSDKNGNVHWMNTNGGNATYEIKAVKTDSWDNIYVCGSFGGTMEMNGSLIVQNTGTDMFIAKFDSSGTYQWVRYNQGNISNEVYDLAVSDSGGVFISGSFRNTALDFQDTVFTSSGLSDGYIAAYDRNGTFKWAHQVMGAVGDVHPRALAIEDDGIVTVINQNDFFISTIGGTSLPPGFNRIRMAPNTGQLVGADFLGGQCIPDEVAYYPDGSFLVAGNYADTMQIGFSLTQVASTNGTNLFLVRYDSLANPLWMRTTTCDPGGNISLYDVDIDPSGNVLLTGKIEHNQTFGNTPFQTGPGINGFLSMWNSAGVHQWTHSATSTGNNGNDFRGVAMDDYGHAFIIGNFTRNIEFQTGLSLANPSTFSLFIARINYPVIQFPSPAPILCSGSTFQLPITTTFNFDSGNQFLIELSDSMGLFTAPTLIGSLNAQGSGIVSCLIPFGVPTGTGYRIRIRSTAFPFITEDNGIDLSIQMNALSFGMVPAMHCVSSTFSLPFTLVCDLDSGNVFTVALSDINGSFSTPTTIGTQQTSSSGSINVTFPASLPAGQGYRIRMQSSLPADTTADNGYDMTIFASTLVPTVTLWGLDSLVSSPAAAYQWKRNGLAINGAIDQWHVATQTGLFTVVTTDTNGCEAESSGLQLTLTSLPPVEESRSQLSVWPNPNHGEGWIKVEQQVPGWVNFTMVDLTGKTVYSKKVWVDLSATLPFHCPPILGMYMLNITLEDGQSFYQKIIRLD